MFVLVIVQLGVIFIMYPNIIDFKENFREPFINLANNSFDAIIKFQDEVSIKNA